MGEIRERLMKDFLDVLILQKMRKMEFTGYDVLTYIHNEFDLMISSGTVYSMLYAMEREGLIEGKTIDRRRVYSLTGRGEAKLKIIHDTSDVILGLLAKLVKDEGDTSLKMAQKQELIHAL